MLHGSGAHRHRGLWSGRFGPGRRAWSNRATPWPSSTATPRPSGGCPPDWPGTTIVGSGFDRGRPRPGPGRRGRLPGRRDQRRQLQHPDRPHRPRDLRDPQRGGPDLRPPAGPDLPAPGHPHRGHGVLDHRPGPPAAGARRGGVGVDRLHRHPVPGGARAARAVGWQAAGRALGARRGDRGRGDPGRGGPPRLRRPGRPGRRRPPRHGHRRRPRKAQRPPGRSPGRSQGAGTAGGRAHRARRRTGPRGLRSSQEDRR